MSVPGELHALVERFDRDRVSYRSGRERTVIGHQITATDRQIERLVYELYDVTDHEINIIEEATVR